MFICSLDGEKYLIVRCLCIFMTNKKIPPSIWYVYVHGNWQVRRAKITCFNCFTVFNHHFRSKWRWKLCAGCQTKNAKCNFEDPQSKMPYSKCGISKSKQRNARYVNVHFDLKFIDYASVSTLVKERATAIIRFIFNNSKWYVEIMVKLCTYIFQSTGNKKSVADVDTNRWIFKKKKTIYITPYSSSIETMKMEKSWAFVFGIKFSTFFFYHGVKWALR